MAKSKLIKNNINKSTAYICIAHITLVVQGTISHSHQVKTLEIVALLYHTFENEIHTIAIKTNFTLKPFRQFEHQLWFVLCGQISVFCNIPYDPKELFYV